MFASTIQDYQLTIGAILRHGRTIHAESHVVTFDGQTCRRVTFETVADRVDRLAAALRRLGIAPGDRVATLAWNSQEHLECYLAIPAMGAVLHTANPRLFPSQLAYTIKHAGDKVIIVDACLAETLAAALALMDESPIVIVIGDGDLRALKQPLRYEKLLAAEISGAAWPELDERTGASICYTSGTTGEPKGVVYSHRAVYLHSLGIAAGSALALNERDRILPVVPMFHANAWGLPHAGWLFGADLIFPGRFVQAAPLCQLIAAERPTISAAVPTVWNGVLTHAEDHPTDLTSLRLIMCGGAALPRALMETFEERHGVPIIQAWGMTETGPIAALAHPPRHGGKDSNHDWRARTGRVIAGVEVRIVDDAGNILPWDGAAIGEIQTRGPWVTGSYLGEPTPEKFQDGWLRTGDIGAIHPNGFLQISDRAKDVIKSGGEWISSVELEGALMGHPEVMEASVIGIPDTRWQERPLACVVVRPGSTVTPDELRAFLSTRVARWWLPDRWSFVSEIPKTSVGKFDKKTLRARQADGVLSIVASQAD